MSTLTPPSPAARETQGRNNQSWAVTLTVVRPKIRAVSTQPGSHRHESSHDAATLDRPVVAGSYSMRIPATPITLSAAARHRGSGLKFLALSILAFCTAGFLAWEIPSTPALGVRMAIVAGVCGIAGLTMFHLALRNLLGQVCVDSHGVSWTPRYTGFAIPWKDLHHWSVDAAAIHLRSTKSKSHYSIERDLLTVYDQNRLIGILASCVSEREVSPQTAAAS